MPGSCGYHLNICLLGSMSGFHGEQISSCLQLIAFGGWQCPAKHRLVGREMLRPSFPFTSLSRTLRKFLGTKAFGTVTKPAASSCRDCGMLTPIDDIFPVSSAHKHAEFLPLWGAGNSLLPRQVSEVWGPPPTHPHCFKELDTHTLAPAT